MNENQFCFSRKKSAVFPGNSIIGKIFSCAVVTDRACIEEGNAARLCAAVSSSAVSQTPAGYGKPITWENPSATLVVKQGSDLFSFLNQECISKLFNYAA